ncbi:glycerophosphodiester phosphodiesterase [Nocardioides sp.]|uniref:glycerophosphodiester phosphodiesterase n=1 Tax=Nocardioides sp. TaxID=35761 RepID=UPI002618424A|nr:glycerophosphodiester phosphodiesterase [Nocardioides sp.]MDI6908251.1 glycerophosphodiester phosphodiesterase [Nocardioides sp.]
MSLLAIAHRAGNSLAGLHEANLLGADIIECDVHAHRGRLEVRHLKTAGPLPFLWDRWELASASAPRLGLAELLDADRRGTTFMLDLKGRSVSTGRAVAELLHERARQQPVLVCGRYWPAVEAVARLPYARLVLSARNRAELAALLRRLDSVDRCEGADRTPPYGVSLHRSLLDAALVGRLRRTVEVVMTWPIDDLDRLDRVVGFGANGLITNEPEILREVGRRSR